MSGVTLTQSESATILQLQATTSLFNTTSTDLNTGKKVNTAADNALAFFESQALYQRASNFTTYKSQIDQATQGLTAALNSTSTIGTLLQQLQGVVQGAESATTGAAKLSATNEIKTLGQQIVQLVKDSSYQGVNLLQSTSATLRTQFSERTASALTVTGFNLIATAGSNKNALFTGANAVFNNTGFLLSGLFTSHAGTTGGVSSLTGVFTSQATGEAIFNQLLQTISTAISTNNSISSQLGTNVAILQARSSFSANYSATLSGGGDKLTLADLNLESASAQALQLRQSIGIQVLSLANTQTQSILNLLR